MTATVAMIAATLTMATPSYAAPAAPVNLSPDGGSVTGVPTLSWDWVPGATSYVIQVSGNQDFTGTLVDSATTTNRQYVPDSTLPASVYWRVAAKDSSGTSDYATAHFSRTIAAAPTQLTPSNGANVRLPDASATLTWTAVPGALSYDIKIGPDFDNPNGFLTKTLKVTAAHYRPAQLGTHFWQVRALVSSSGGANVYTEWSAVQTFVVQPLRLPDEWADAASPQGLSSVQDAVLDWDPVPGAVTYQVQLHTDRAFPSSGLISQTGITGTRWARPATLLNDQYYWRVRPVDAYGLTPDWSTVPVFSFQRAWADQPVPTYPANNSNVGNPFYYEWTPADRLASRYAVQLTTDSTFNTDVQTCYTVHTTYVPSKDDCMPDPGLAYYWRVIGIDGSGNWNSTSVPVTEVVNAQVNQFTMAQWKAQRLSPADGASGPPPTLRWAPVSGATEYRVTLSSTNGGPNTTYTTAATQLDITTNLFPELLTPAVEQDLPGDPVRFNWQVVPVDAAGRVGNGTIASGWQYTVTQDDAGTANQPNPISPANGTAFERFPSLKWTALPVASTDPEDGDLSRYTYRVFVRKAGSTVWPATPEGVTYHASFTDLDSNNLAPGNYEWMVQAMDGQTPVSATSPSNIGAFTIAPPTSTTTIGSDGSQVTLPSPVPEVVGEGVSLRANATGDARCTLSVQTDAENCAGIPETPILSWAPIPNAGYYQIYLSADQALTHLLPGYPQRVDRPLFRPVVELPDSQAGIAYYWYVQACTVDGKCASTASAKYGFEKIANPVVVNPPDPTYGTDATSGAPIVRDDVTLSWQDYVDTNLNADTSGSDLPDRATLEADKYRIEIATDASFGNKEIYDVDQKQFTLADDTYNEGDIYWRVQARDQSGNYLPYSATQHMIRRSPTPTLLEPSDGGSSSGTRLVWQPLPFAASYDVEIYKTWNATTQSGATLLTDNAVAQSMYAFATPLPAQATPYYWRVRRNDAKGKDGQWSQMFSFRWTGQNPQLLSPATGERVEPNEEVFRWAPADPAMPPVAYRWQRRKAGQTSLTDNFKTYATAWAPTSTIADGDWEWRVVALDADDAELGATGWRAFTSSTKPLVVQPPEITGGVQVGQVLSVSTMPVFEPADVTLAWQWLVSGSAVADATGTSFTVRPSDVGRAITVRVTASRSGYANSTVTAAAQTGAAGEAPHVEDPVPSISGDSHVGGVLTVGAATWSIDGVATRYQWKVGTKSVGSNSATSTSYTVAPSDVGQPITVVVTGTRTSYATGSYTTGEATAILGIAPTSPVPSVTGTAQVGSTLSASGLAWTRAGASAGGSTTYQWRRDGAMISGATRSTYVPTDSDAGHLVSVQAARAQAGYETGYVTSTEVLVTAKASSGSSGDASGSTGGGTSTPPGATGSGFALGAPSHSGAVDGAPRIVRITPAVGRTVKKSGPIKITFSEPVTGATKAVRLTYKGKKVKLKVTYDARTRTLTIKPKSKLKHGKKYKIVVRSIVKDLTGVRFSTSSWQFKAK
ncbi:Ig-like domain-containing protein [Nocardioides terrae]|uniref:Ig-like domain-containing protein n=1 Tax=Nocardioides terrae TaxID=574651 RepID=UPI001587B771|nr:Ig-like domain-containing protein [Nocardioides terrae]